MGTRRRWIAETAEAVGVQLLALLFLAIFVVVCFVAGRVFSIPRF